jgi:hypothetical protein
MRSLTPTESRLLTFLVAAVFLALNIAGAKVLMTTLQNQKSATEAATLAIEESRLWIEEAAELSPLSRNLPPAPAMDEKTSGSNLIQSVRSAAESAGLTIIEESLPGQPEGSTDPVAVLRAKMNGPFSGMVRFLYDIQQPGQWRSMEMLTLKAEASPQNVLAEMEIRQYYSLSGPAAATTTQDPAPSPQ